MSIGVGTQSITLGSGGSQGSDLDANGVDPGAFYSMQTINYIDPTNSKPVAFYNSAGVLPANIASTTNIVVYTPIGGSIFGTLMQQTGQSWAFPVTLTLGVISGDNEDDASTLASYVSPTTLGSNTINGVYNALGAGVGVNRVSSLNLSGGSNNLSGQAISSQFFNSNGIISNTYPAYTIKFLPGGSKWAAPHSGALNSTSVTSVTIDFVQSIAGQANAIANLVQMLDLNDPNNSAFGRNVSDYPTFVSYYTNFLDSVGALLLHSVQSAINQAIINTTSTQSQNANPYTAPFNAGTTPTLDQNNKTIADDIAQINSLINTNTITASAGASYISNLNQEQQMLLTMSKALQSDIANIVVGDGSAEANINQNNQFGKFCTLYKQIMDRLWQGLIHTSSKSKNSTSSISKQWQVEPSPSVILGNGIDSNVAAAEASNQIIGVARNNSNNLGTYTDFTIPLSVLDIIRDEATNPKKDNVINTKTISQASNSDNCSAFWANQSPQAILDTMLTLKIQLCSEIDNMSSQMTQLKRLQFSNDFKLASLLSGFKGISFSNFGIPSFGSLVPTFSLPNFGIPDYSLSDFGIPNIGLDLNTNLAIPNITLPKLSIPSIGGINLPSIQSFNFDWNSIDVTLPKISIQNMSLADITAKLQFPNVNWNPDFNFASLAGFSNPLSCGGLPVTVPGVKLKFNKGQSCAAASNIQALGSQSADSVAKTQKAQKTATATLTKYGDIVDGLQKSMTRCSDLQSSIVTCQQQFIARVQALQQQTTTQISTSVTTALTPLGNIVPTSSPTKNKTALAPMPTTQTAINTPTVQV